MSPRRQGVALLSVAFALRVLHRVLMVSFAEPYQGPAGLPEIITTWFEAGLPIAVEVLSLAAVVAGAVLLVTPILRRPVDALAPEHPERLDA